MQVKTMKSNSDKLAMGVAILQDVCPWCGATFENLGEVMNHDKSCSEREEEEGAE